MRKFTITLLVLLSSVFIKAQIVPNFKGDESFFENKAGMEALDTLVFDGTRSAKIDSLQIGFTPPLQFMRINNNTFVNFQTSSFIQISEIKKVVYLLAVKNLTPEILEPQGVRFISSEEIMTSLNKEGILVYLSHQIEGKEFERMMLFTGDYLRTIWISATYPLELKSSVHDILKKSLLSIEF
jgi:hypothetical protein